MKAGICFVAGVGVGVTLGLMLAPQSGSETQDYIAQQAGSTYDRASAAARDLRRQAGDLADSARAHAAGVAEEAKEAYREGVGSA
jgi:gas vesicle protein